MNSGRDPLVELLMNLHEEEIRQSEIWFDKYFPPNPNRPKKIIIMSTPTRTSGYFYKMWKRRKRND